MRGTMSALQNILRLGYVYRVQINSTTNKQRVSFHLLYLAPMSQLSFSMKHYTR